MPVKYKAVKIPKESYDKLNTIKKVELERFKNEDVEKFDMLSNMGAGAFIGYLLSQIARDKLKEEKNER